MHAVLFVALAPGVFGLLPRLGGVAHDAAELRHAGPGFIVAAVVAQAASLAAYTLLYRSVQVSRGGRLGFPLAARVVLALTSLVSTLALMAVAYAAANIASAIPITPGGRRLPAAVHVDH